MRFIPELLDSIMKQTYTDFNVLVIDNASSDGVDTYIRENYPSVAVLRNAKNLGFSGAHNQGIRYALDHWDQDELGERYVLVTNPDIIMSETFLEELVARGNAQPEAGAFGGKLYRAFGENVQDEVFRETIKSDRLDSTGLKAFKNRTFADRGAGEMDEGQYDKPEQVFGISGALVMYRGSALQGVRFEDEFFDTDFFAYKEDVDMAWRMQHLGWDAWYEPRAVAYHYRGMYGPEKMGWRQRISNRRNKSSFRSYYSNRNHWLMLWKNLTWVNGLLSFPRVFLSEAARFVYTLLFEPGNLKSFFDAVGLFPKIMQKRRLTMAARTRTSKSVRSWFV